MNRDLLKLCSSKIGPLVGQGSSYSEPKGSDKEVLALLNFFQDSSAQVLTYPSSFCLYICEVSVCLSVCISVRCLSAFLSVGCLSVFILYLYCHQLEIDVRTPFVVNVQMAKKTTSAPFILLSFTFSPPKCLLMIYT